MSGNTIGKIFRVTTFGESHGIALGGIIDGMPPKILLNENDIQIDLDRRKSYGRFTTPRKELDKVKILSGVFNGLTTGSSIGILIENNEFKSKDYENIKNIYRPGHADYTYDKKYGIRDYRGGGRSSARETVIRVAAGAIAKKYLKDKYNIIIRGYLSKMGNINCKFENWNNVNNNPFFCSDLSKIKDLENLIDKLKDSGNSIGAKLKIIAENVPVGLGDPVFDRLDADIAHSLMSINAVKGIEIGDGFSVVEKLGSENRDEIFSSGFSSNHSGGILGGISTGQNIITAIALKPTSSISVIGNTIDKYGEETKISIKGRHDPCVGIRAVPIAEAMISITIMDHLLRYKAQCNNI